MASRVVSALRPTLCYVFSCLLAALARPALAQDSFATQVPAEVGFFVELRNSEDLLNTLMEPQLWTTLAEIAGQPANDDEAEQWRKRIERTVRMSPTEAIRVLLSQQVAFVGDGLGRSHDGVVLFRPAGRSPNELLDSWKAQPVAESTLPDTRQLPGAIGVATFGPSLLMGDLNPPDGMFRRLVAGRRASNAKRLSDDPIYRSLLARVPAEPTGVLFARLPRSGVTSRPTSSSASAAVAGALTPIDAADAFLLALHRDGERLHITAVTSGPITELPRPPRLERRLLDGVPGDALVIYESSVDFSHLGQVLDALPPKHPLRLAARLPNRNDLLQRLTQSLDGQFCVAVGRAATGATTRPSVPLPTLALLLKTRDAAAAEAEFSGLIDACVAMGNIVLLAKNRPTLPAIESRDEGGVVIHTLDLSPLVAGRDVVEETHITLAWQVDGDTLIFATDPAWLAAVRKQRAGGTASAMAQRLKTARPPITADAVSILASEGAPIALLAQQWLDFLKQTAPDVLTADWWRTRQPLGGRVRLGVDVEPVTDVPTALRVRSTVPGEPADGRLRKGDLIVGCNGKVFATTQPIDEIRTGIEKRPHLSRFDLLVQRGEAKLAVSLPLPLVNPIQLLRRVAAIGSVARSVTWYEDWSDPAGPRGHLTVELQRQPPAPASRPVSAPAKP